MNVDAKFLIGVALCVLATSIIGASCGSLIGKGIQKERDIQEQIEAGRAYWWCDPQTGAKELKWKDVCK